MAWGPWIIVCTSYHRQKRISTIVTLHETVASLENLNTGCVLTILSTCM